MIRPGETIRCAACERPFTYHFGKPGRVNECPDCASDIETPIASETDAEGAWVLVPRRLKQRYEITLPLGSDYAPASGHGAKGAAL
jgi:hypothetical protein